MMETIENKRKLIKERDEDGSLIFNPPHDDTLYTIPELKIVLKPLINSKIPRNLTPVQRAHWTKYKILDMLGYKRPCGFRTKEAKKHKPKMIHQLMDMFVQKSSNLQIWNYVPYSDVFVKADWRDDKKYRYSDYRYIILKIDEDNAIKAVLIKQGQELESWNTTGTETIKWQATITRDTGTRAEGCILHGKNDPILNKMGIKKEDLKPLEHRIDEIRRINREKDEFLITKPTTKDLLITIGEIGHMLNGIIGVEIEDRGEKLTGQYFQKLVAENLGYILKEGFSINLGAYPDLVHQAIETKFQFSPTIDLGRHLPTDDKILDFVWNRYQISSRDVRYVIGIADKIEDKFKLKGIVITSGEDFEDFFSICEGINFKVQMIIPNFDSL